VLLIIGLLFLIGYSSQRSSVCMVRAVQEVIDRQRVHRLAGLLLAAASAMLVMAGGEAAGAAPFETISGTKPGGLAVAGGVLFGLGARINGFCAIGTLAVLTAGKVSRVATLAAMFVAAIVLGPNMSKAALMLPEQELMASPLAGQELSALVLGALLALIPATYIYRRLGWKRPRGGWSPLVAMSIIGASSGLLFALDQKWAYTSRIAEIADGEAFFTFANLAGPVAMLTGMVVAAIRGGQFHLRFGNRREWAAATIGGLLMGMGATMVPGGNDAMLFTGIPLLLPNLLVAFAAFGAVLYVGMRVSWPGQERSALP
jgi:uncharacterized protein